MSFEYPVLNLDIIGYQQKMKHNKKYYFTEFCITNYNHIYIHTLILAFLVLVEKLKKETTNTMNIFEILF